MSSLNEKYRSSNTNSYNIVVTQKKNNFTISVTDENGDLIFWESPGTIGYSKSARKNFYTYQEVSKALSYRMEIFPRDTKYKLIFKGICKGKQSIVNTLSLMGVEITSITSEVFFAKNGCRPRKKRRL